MEGIDWGIITTVAVLVVGYYTKQVDKKIDKMSNTNTDQWKMINGLSNKVERMDVHVDNLGENIKRLEKAVNGKSSRSDD